MGLMTQEEQFEEKEENHYSSCLSGDRNKNGSLSSLLDAYYSGDEGQHS